MQTMKGLLVGSAIVAVFGVVVSASSVLGHGNERGTASARFQGGTVAVEYGRPMLKGRDLLSLIRPGSYWRLGADRATTLTTDVGLRSGAAVSVPPGKYTLLLKCMGDDDWSLIIANGAAPGSWEPQGVIAELPMATSKLDAVVEMLTIELSSQQDQGRLTVEWGEVSMVAEFTAAS